MRLMQKRPFFGTSETISELSNILIQKLLCTSWCSIGCTEIRLAWVEKSRLGLGPFFSQQASR